MRFRIAVSPAGTSWIVRAIDLQASAVVTDANGTPIERPLEAVGDPPALAVPLPPKDEQPAAAASSAIVDEVFFQLCTAVSTQRAQTLLAKFTAKTLTGEELVAFGRYLFATLIGTALWSRIDALTPQDEWIDLVLALPADAALTRLPWELMHTGKEFLAELPQVSLVRELETTKVKYLEPDGRLKPLARTPRVLFAIGTQLQNDVVRPGAEYMQLVRMLFANDLDLRTSIVCEASAERIKAAVAEFEPDIVHFICHGSIDNKGAYLSLVDDGDPTRRKTVATRANALKDVLQGTQAKPRELPRLVVLSACYTATTQVTKPGQLAANDLAQIGQIITPLAAALVEAGVPIVIGMSGPIADQACRLFTRAFYESLARRSDTAQATAVGRLSAVSAGGQSDPKDGVEWALPIIFVCRGLARATLDVQPTADDIARQERWKMLGKKWPYPVANLFCDRFDVFERFDLLLADQKAQQALTLSQRLLDTLVIEVPAKDEEDRTSLEVPRLFGRSHLLQELAAKAYADGHLPVLISEKRGKEPKTVDELLARINGQTQVVLSRLNLPAVRLRVLDWLSTLGKGPPIAVPDFVPETVAYDVKNLKAGADIELSTKAKALCHDFLVVLEQVRQHCRPSADASHTRLVLLIDDLHRIEGGAVGDILKELIGGLGLSSITENVRVVLAWASVAATGQETAVKAMENFVNGLPREAKITIERFGKRFGDLILQDEKQTLSVEERLAYEFFLLRKQELSVRAQALQPLIAMFWQTCRLASDAVPSRLEVGVKSALQAAQECDALDALFQPVDDDTRLLTARGRTR